jgi:rhodanese-related sulfurtransferase
VGDEDSGFSRRARDAHVPARAYNELDPDERIVVICHHGVRSLNVANWLRNQGFEQAQSLRGGIDAWSRDVDPAMARY